MLYFCTFCFLEGFILICFLLSAFLVVHLYFWWTVVTVCYSPNPHYEAVTVSILFAYFLVRKTSNLKNGPWIWCQNYLTIWSQNNAKFHPVTKWIKSLLVFSVKSQGPVIDILVGTYSGEGAPCFQTSDIGASKIYKNKIWEYVTVFYVLYLVTTAIKN